MRFKTVSGKSFNRLYFLRSISASLKVVVSGAVGPLAIASKGSPTTSLIIREITVAG